MDCVHSQQRGSAQSQDVLLDNQGCTQSWYRQIAVDGMRPVLPRNAYFVRSARGVIIPFRSLDKLL